MWTCYTFTEDSHNTGNFMPYSFRIMCGFFNVPQNCEQSRVVRRGLRFIVVIREDLKVLTICRCNYKGSTFSSVILRPWVLVRPESNSRPPAGQTVAQPTEPPVLLISDIKALKNLNSFTVCWREEVISRFQRKRKCFGSLMHLPKSPNITKSLDEYYDKLPLPVFQWTRPKIVALN